MIAIVDYDVGNLFSLKCSLNFIGFDCAVTSDKKIISKAEKVILPGVGAFKDARLKLKKAALDDFLIDLTKSGKDLLGICLGMQMLFDKSFEHTETSGLGLIHGEVRSIEEFATKNVKIPQIGWNSLEFKNKNCKLLKYINQGDYVYFVHSYCASNCNESLVATTDYWCDVPAIVANNNVYGCQFHPEKSGQVGLNILKAFCEN